MKKKEGIAGKEMTQGFSGGFFLPAQRSVHCKGGFFSSATRGTAPAGATGNNATSSRSTAPFPVLFSLPQVPPTENASDATTIRVNPKPRNNRVYDPHEGEEGWDIASDDIDARRPETETTVERVAATTSRFARGRQQQHEQQQKKRERATPRTTSSRSNNASRHAPMRPRQHSQREQPQATPPTETGDINSKFEIAMKELHQIKDEFDFKNQRQHSAPVLPAHQSILLTQRTSVAIATPNPQLTSSPNQPPPPQDVTTVEDAPPRDMQSPRQQLQVAEMVMRKLYKKNLQTEQELAAVKTENEQLAKKLAELHAEKESREETGRSRASQLPGPSTSSTSTTSVCARCTMVSAVGVALAKPPSMETISRIDAQQLEYLRHLAAEQDRTIISLKWRIEELSCQLTMAKQQAMSSGKTPKASPSPLTPRHAKTKLQTKLKDALSESDRQKTNYLKLKRDFQHLLALKTKTLYANPTQLDASAKQLVALMDKQLQQLESEHSLNLSLYNSKLYESEQQSCESYAQRRLLEEEMQRVAQDVQQRDALDVEIEQCMANVFERLHHVESENLHLRNHAIQSSQSSH